MSSESNEWEDVPLRFGYAENMRSIGAADMAYAIRSGRSHRANGALACHVLEVMHAFEKSAQVGSMIEIMSRPAQPAPLPPNLAHGHLDA